MMAEESTTSAQECDHNFMFLRQEEVPHTTWGDRVREWKIYDVYYCTKCCEYKSIHVRTDEPSRSDYKRTTTWRRLA